MILRVIIKANGPFAVLITAYSIPAKALARRPARKHIDFARFHDPRLTEFMPKCTFCVGDLPYIPGVHLWLLAQCVSNISLESLNRVGLDLDTELRHKPIGPLKTSADPPATTKKIYQLVFSFCHFSGKSSH